MTKHKRLEVGERILFDSGAGPQAHEVVRVTSGSAGIKRSTGRKVQVTFHNKTVHKNGLSYKVPIEPVVVELPDPAEARVFTISPYSMVERVEEEA